MKTDNHSSPLSVFTKEKKIIMAANFFFRQKNFVLPKHWVNHRAEITDTSVINYYSQEKRTNINSLCTENTALFFVELALVLNDPLTSLEQKIESIVLQYVDLLFENPDFAMAILHELLSEENKNKTENARMQFVLNSLFMKQLYESKKKKNFNPIPLLINLIGMLLLPLAIKNDNFNSDFNFNSNQLKDLIEQRKKLLPIWIAANTEY